jgi:NCS1 family nucleobase:cation symporter-1
VSTSTSPPPLPASGAQSPPPGSTTRLYNEDLAPSAERSWGTYSLFAMWMSDVHSIGGYTFAAGLFFLGIAAWQVVIAMLIGIGFVYSFMLMSGRAGQKTGVPFPVIGRIAFGVYGANLAAVCRAIIGIAFYGIQTYLASVSLQILLLGIFPGLKSLADHTIIGQSEFGWICFLALSVAQGLVMRRGMETVRKLADYAGPIVYAAMFVLCGWILIKAHFNISLDFGNKGLSDGKSRLEFFTVIGLVVSYFSALFLNYCDFSRFAPDVKTVKRGTLLGLPLNFAVFALLTLLVTAGTVAVYHVPIQDPVELVSRIHSTPVVIFGAFVFTTATVGINIVANYVSPAYDLANVAPGHIDFKRGGLITSVLAVVVCPWYLYSSTVAIDYFLGGLGAVLGPLFGVMMVDFFRVKRQDIKLEDLYVEGPEGRYWYTNGWNLKAVTAFGIGAVVAVPIALLHVFTDAAPFAWFIGTSLAGASYLAISMLTSTGAAPEPAAVALAD